MDHLQESNTKVPTGPVSKVKMSLWQSWYWPIIYKVC